MKRILIVNYEFPPLGGGGGVFTMKLAKGYIENGYEVDYLTSGFKGLPAFEIVDGINVYRVKVLGRTGLQTATMISLLSYPVAGFLTGIRLCRKYKYEFINTHFVVPSGPLGYVLAKLFRLPNILSIHGGDIHDPSKGSSPHKHWYLRATVRFLLNAAHRIVAQSSNTKENAVRYYHPAKPIEIIPIPYEPFPFAPATKAELGMDERKKYIIGAGRLVARKGFDTFVRTLALLDTSIAGIVMFDGPERGNLEKLAKELGVDDRFTLTGAVSEEKKFQYLSNADVFVLSSIHEGFGIVLQEAMQVGLPLVSTNFGGQVDIVHEGVNGYLVPPNDPEALAKGVRKALEGTLSGGTEAMASFNPKTIGARYIALV